MKTWNRGTYVVIEKEFDYDLHQFEVARGDDILATITPGDLKDQEGIIEALDAGEGVDGWEDGMGNVISVD